MKNILITGASRGVGYQTALELIRRGCRVLAVSRSEDGLERLKREAGDGVKRLEVLSMDITSDPESLRQWLDELGVMHVHGLVNNAGTLVNKPFTEISGEELRKVYEVNLQAPFRLIQALLPLMTGEWAHVVNISSVGGVGGSLKFAGLSAYSSSKGALNILTECLAEEYKESGIRFNCLALGAVQTEMLEEAFPGYVAPIGPESIGAYVAGFVLDGWQYYNGKILQVSSSTP